MQFRVELFAIENLRAIYIYAYVYAWLLGFLRSLSRKLEENTTTKKAAEKVSGSHECIGAHFISNNFCFHTFIACKYKLPAKVKLA